MTQLVSTVAEGTDCGLWTEVVVSGVSVGGHVSQHGRTPKSDEHGQLVKSRKHLMTYYVHVKSSQRAGDELSSPKIVGNHRQYWREGPRARICFATKIFLSTGKACSVGMQGRTHLENGVRGVRFDYVHTSAVASVQLLDTASNNYLISTGRCLAKPRLRQLDFPAASIPPATQKAKRRRSKEKSSRKPMDCRGECVPPLR